MNIVPLLLTTNALGAGGGSVLATLRARMNSGRVDFVGIGDSNQIRAATGWDHGFQYALSQNFPMYASGLISINENDSLGAGTGYFFGYNSSAGLIGTTTGAPAFQHDYLDKGSGDLTPHEYGYLSTGSVSSTDNSGILLYAGGPLDETDALDFEFHYATFATGSGGQFATTVRLEASPFTKLVSGGPYTTTTGSDGMEIAKVSISADAGRSGKNLGGKWTDPGDYGITAPFFGLWCRISAPGTANGFSYHTLDFRGGQSLRTMAYDLQQMSDTALDYFIGECLRLQGEIKTLVFVINSGLNDRQEAGTSVGTGAITDGDSAEAYVDNTDAIVQRVFGRCDANGWDRSWIYWLIVPSHPVSTPDDAKLLSYRAAEKVYALTIPNMQVIDLNEITTQADYVSNGWYAAGPDVNHLTQAGYEDISALALEA